MLFLLLRTEMCFIISSSRRLNIISSLVVTRCACMHLLYCSFLNNCYLSGQKYLIYIYFFSRYCHRGAIGYGVIGSRVGLVDIACWARGEFILHTSLHFFLHFFSFVSRNFKMIRFLLFIFYYRYCLKIIQTLPSKTFLKRFGWFFACWTLVVSCDFKALC